jgi:hypothetical protein
MSVRVRVALVAILATVLAGNAGATIYAAATAPTIRACVSTKTGAMRYVPTKPCAKGETAITWNVTGPTGPAGPAGPAGGSGGSAGPAPYWVAEWSPEPIFSATSVTTSLAVPAGTYLVSLQLAIGSDTRSVPDVKPTSSTPPVTIATCTLVAGPETATFAGFLFAGWQSSLSHQLVATTTGGKVSVTCSQKTTGDGVIAPFIRLAIDGLLTATPIAIQ